MNIIVVGSIFCPPLFLPVQFSAPKKNLRTANFSKFWLILAKFRLNLVLFWLILAYFNLFLAIFGKKGHNSCAKSNLNGYLYVINYNFVTTGRILKIRNSAKSYFLAESEFSAP